jgi:hypothetical protein
VKKIYAIKVAHTLSEPSAMPCYAYSLPASACKAGAELAKVEGSICNDCYALKGRYAMPNTQAALHARLESLEHPLWVDAMVALIGDEVFFRWHDSGDIQSVAHFGRICDVCRRTPHCKHWLPTRERGMVSEYLKTYLIPDNLIVRISATMFDSPAVPIQGVSTTSGAHKHQPPIGFECQKPQHQGTCGPCRACWDKAVPHVSYKAH